MRSDPSLAAAADTKSHPFASIFAMLAPHMAELDRFLHGQLAEFEPEIRPMVDDCVATSGKRLRPALVFLSGWRGAGEVAPDLVRVAAVVELVHLATLVHDDLTDEAAVHCSQRVAAREFGPTPAVLLGDALFAHGLHLATQFPTTEICAAVTESTRRVCAGEIVQTQRRLSTDITRADYQRIVELKTAELFRFSCFFGARLSGSEPSYVEAASRFGWHLGIAYQIYDDLADFLGEKTRIGKTLTLPLLALLERLPAAEADALRTEIASGRPPQLALRLRQTHQLALFPVIADAVQTEVTAATTALREWSGHPPTPLLLGLCDVLQAQVAGLRPAGTA
jgi:octaprenyl-diphosphate synthase